uniref:Si:ch211-225b7.5 n=1 Tax=Pygocentrus nattereri TaxID=42514 RepID=A0A3B4DNM1_PYGNA
MTVAVSLLLVFVIVLLAAVVYTPRGVRCCRRRNMTEEHLSLTDSRVS